MPSHSDFTLPGLSHRGLSTWIAAISFGYSGQWNSRRLENHFYSFWNYVFLDLVDDLTPDFIVIPQFQLDTFNDKPLAPDTSISTTAQTEAKELTPDFSIAALDLVRRYVPVALPTPPLFPTDFNLWRDVRVETMKIPLIAELKRPPSRCAKSGDVFLQDLRTNMKLAQHDLIKQVEHAFLMQPSVDEIALVACCGEWWSWTISTRATHTQGFSLSQGEAGPPAEDEGEDAAVPHDVPESRTREIHPRPAKMHHKGKYRDSSPPPPSESDKISYKPRSEVSDCEGGPKKKDKKKKKKKKEVEFIRYTEFEGATEYVKPNVEDALPSNDEWSLPILFGSEASAQHFFLIHRFLEAERLMPGTEDQVSLYLYNPDVCDG